MIGAESPDPMAPALLGAALALLASAVALGLSLAIRRPRVGAVLAIGLGYAAGQATTLGRPSWPPPEAIAWLLPIALLATAFGLLDASITLPRAARWAGRSAVSGAMLGMSLRSPILNDWAAWESAAWLVGLLAVTVASWANFDALAERMPGPSATMAMAVVAGMGAGCLMISGSLKLGGLGMALSSALAPLALLGLISPGRAAGRGVAAAVVPLFLALLVQGHFYAELPRGVAALLVASPALAWVGRVGALGRLGPRARAIACAAIVAIPAGAALGWAFAASPPMEPEVEPLGMTARPAILARARPGGRGRSADGCAS